MSTLTAVLLASVILAGPAAAQDVVFNHDVKQHIQQGDKTHAVDVSVTIGTEAVTITRTGAEPVTIAFEAISGMTYDRRRRRSGWRMQGSPPRQQHMLTIQFKTGTAGDFVELEMPKDIAPRLVATLEAKSGKPIEKIVG